MPKCCCHSEGGGICLIEVYKTGERFSRENSRVDLPRQKLPGENLLFLKSEGHSEICPPQQRSKDFNMDNHRWNNTAGHRLFPLLETNGNGELLQYPITRQVSFNCFRCSCLKKLKV